MFKKLMLSLVAVVALCAATIHPAEAYGGRGGGWGYGPGAFIVGAGVGALAGVAVADTYAYDHSYYPGYATPYPYYYAAPVYQPPVVVQSTSLPCKAYNRQVIVNGYVTNQVGTVCLQPDGSWQVVR